jgi:Histidine kinase-, DNA gyrase B-, and HSP90-like ATPase
MKISSQVSYRIIPSLTNSPTMALRAFHSNPGIGGFGGANISYNALDASTSSSGREIKNRLSTGQHYIPTSVGTISSSDQHRKSNDKDNNNYDDRCRNDISNTIDRNNENDDVDITSKQFPKHRLDKDIPHRPKEILTRRQSSSKTSHGGAGTRTSTGDGDGDADCDGYGFEFQGDESDAICQIVKELVDNSIDACRHTTTCSAGGRNSDDDEKRVDWRPSKRIRVEIRPYQRIMNRQAFGIDLGDGDGDGGDDDNENYNENEKHDDQWEQELMEIQVTDNGCGMENIQGCVDAFQSSKGRDENNDTTSGRYGVGLTLALLHSQRLVRRPLCNTVVSTTANTTTRTRAHFKVDTKRDTVICTKKDQVEKQDPKESGTSVRVFVPVRLR